MRRYSAHLKSSARRHSLRNPLLADESDYSVDWVWLRQRDHDAAMMPVSATLLLTTTWIARCEKENSAMQVQYRRSSIIPGFETGRASGQGECG
jgi:hypothetical protein